MDLLIVTALVFLTMRIVGAVVLVLVERPPRRRPVRPPDPCLSPLLGLPPVSAVDPEQELFDRLRSGRVTRDQYRDAIAEMARRDTANPPMRTPGR